MGTKSLMTGCMSALLACTGGAIMIVQASQAAGLSKLELVSWFASAYIIGGVLNILLTLKYKIPFAGAHSITATAFLGTAAAGFTYPELIGAFIMSGALLLLAGMSGLFAKAMEIVPKSLIDALLAGILLSYVWGIFPSAVGLPYAGILAAAGYFVMPKLASKLPPALWALLLGLAGLCLEYRFPVLPHATFTAPVFITPQFSVDGLLAIAIPIAVLILSNDLAVAAASLRSNEYYPPVNTMLRASGMASIVVGLFGGNSANVGGLMSALCSSPEAGHKGERYKAALVSSAIVIVFGAMAWRVVDLIHVLPSPFVIMMTGFSLMGLFLRGVRNVFAVKSMLVPALATFTIAALHIHWLGIATPIWALLAGVAVMKALETLKKRDRAVR